MYVFFPEPSTLFPVLSKFLPLDVLILPGSNRASLWITFVLTMRIEHGACITAASRDLKSVSPKCPGSYRPCRGARPLGKCRAKTIEIVI